MFSEKKTKSEITDIFWISIQFLKAEQFRKMLTKIEIPIFFLNPNIFLKCKQLFENMVFLKKKANDFLKSGKNLNIFWYLGIYKKQKEKKKETGKTTIQKVNQKTSEQKNCFRNLLDGSQNW